MYRKNMFEDYDNGCIPGKHKPYMYKPEERLVGSLNAQIIRNIKGEEIGVRAPEGSAFTIYFTFDGFVEDDVLSNLLAEGIYGFELRDNKHNTVLVSPVIIYPESCVASVDLVSEKDGVLCYGNYYMYLYMELDGVVYTLLDERDAVLSIE